MRRQFDERHVRCLSDMPEKTSEFVRAPHVENKRGVILLKPRCERRWLDPRRGHRRVAKPARQQLHGGDPSMLAKTVASSSPVPRASALPPDEAGSTEVLGADFPDQPLSFSASAYS